MTTKFAVHDRVMYQGEPATVMEVGLREATATDENGITTVTKQVPVYLIQEDYVVGEVPPDGVTVIGDDALVALD